MKKKKVSVVAGMSRTEKIGEKEERKEEFGGRDEGTTRRDRATCRLPPSPPALPPAPSPSPLPHSPSSSTSLVTCRRKRRKRSRRSGSGAPLSLRPGTSFVAIAQSPSTRQRTSPSTWSVPLPPPLPQARSQSLPPFSMILWEQIQRTASINVTFPPFTPPSLPLSDLRSLGALSPRSPAHHRSLRHSRRLGACEGARSQDVLPSQGTDSFTALL